MPDLVEVPRARRGEAEEHDRSHAVAGEQRHDRSLDVFRTERPLRQLMVLLQVRIPLDDLRPRREPQRSTPSVVTSWSSVSSSRASRSTTELLPTSVEGSSIASMHMYRCYAGRVDGNGMRMERIKRMTSAAVYGRRGKLVTKASGSIAKRTPFGPDTVRSLFGALFLVLSGRRIVRALRAGLRR